jgi:uncharacterized protein YutE (UPF0331/DUF86 family)
MTPDRRRVDERIERIEAACEALERAAGLGQDEYLASGDTQAATERRLMVAVQAAIDVGSHLVATQGWRTPSTYSGVFAELERHGVLTAGLAERMRMATGLRNILVHDYLDVDPRQLHGSLLEDTDDLRTFCTAVIRWLQEGTP